MTRPKAAPHSHLARALLAPALVWAALALPATADDAAKGFAAVRDIRSDVILVLTDGRSVPFKDAFPEYHPLASGAPFPADEVPLAELLPGLGGFLGTFDRHADGLLERPEIALMYLRVAAANKGLDVAAVTVGGKAVNGLGIGFDDEYGLEALVRQIPATTPEAKTRRRMIRELEFTVDEHIGGGSTVGGSTLGRGGRDTD